MRQWITDFKDHHAAAGRPTRSKTRVFEAGSLSDATPAKTNWRRLTCGPANSPGITSMSVQALKSRGHGKLMRLLSGYSWADSSRISAAINQILTALGEPQLDVYAESESWRVPNQSAPKTNSDNH